MSRKTVTWARKAGQAKRKGKTIMDLIPTGRAVSSGRRTILQSIVLDDEGHTSQKRVPGVASGKTCTEPMKPEKIELLRRRFV